MEILSRTKRKTKNSQIYQMRVSSGRACRSATVFLELSLPRANCPILI
ncbi:hypothetical protein [Methanimicrococcus hongohii]|nr:hypothetical protein [Methanimicrococcus sp. Hf6]